MSALLDIAADLERRALERKGDDAADDARRLRAAAVLVRIVAQEGPPADIDDEIEREAGEAADRYTNETLSGGLVAWRSAVRPLVEVRVSVMRAADAIDARYQALLEKAAAVCNDAEPSEDSPDVSMVGTDVIAALRGEVPAPW